MRITKEFSLRKKEIIEAAQELFLTKDYEQTSMNDLIKSLNIAKGTLYHYFQSKDQLLDAVVENMVDNFFERLKIEQQKMKGDALEKMIHLFQLSKHPDLVEVDLSALHRPGNSILHVRLLGLLVKKMSTLYAEIIQLGCKEKIFKTEYPLESAELIIAGMQFLTDRGIYAWSEEEIERRREHLPSIIETILKAPKGSFQFLQ